jgi:hypothetical protein
MMHGSRLLVALIWVCGVGPLFAEGQLPRQLRVGEAGAVLRCGPGEAYYATDELPPGESLEVWRVEDDGWLAVRPPEGSFSLMATTDLKLIPETDLAAVRGKDVVAWVGSNAGPIDEYRWQVRLDEGEKVVVLSEARQRLFDGAPPKRLYRIEPPAGEFRWVRAQDLQDADRLEPRIDRAVKLADYRVTADEEPSATDWQPRGRVTVSDEASRQRIPTASRPAERIARTESRGRSAALASFAGRLRDLELRLSLMVAEPSESWDFRALRNDAESLLDQASTTLERSRAQRLSDQIEEFAALGRRFDRLERTTGEETPEERGELAEDEAIVDPRFDGHGWLLPVHSTQRMAPPYALLDDDGRVLQFVSPAPGLNLHRYLRKEIGIFGQRSFIPSLDKPHVTAHRVVDLERHRR